MKVFRIEIASIRGSKLTSELSSLVEAKSLREAQGIALLIVENSKERFDSVRIKSVRRYPFN